jgi:hypothetical protein
LGKEEPGGDIFDFAAGGIATQQAAESGFDGCVTGWRGLSDEGGKQKGPG